MKKFLLALLISSFITGVAYATSFDDYTVQQIGQCETYTATQASVTATNSQVTYTKDTKALYIENIGANELYIDPGDGVAIANTAHDKLEPGDNRSLNGFKTRVVGLIASTSETTTALVVACT